MTTQTYPIDIKKLPDGTHEATLPDIPNVTGTGATSEDAAKDLVKKAMPVIGTMQEAGTLPAASPLNGRHGITVTPPIIVS